MSDWKPAQQALRDAANNATLDPAKVQSYILLTRWQQVISTDPLIVKETPPPPRLPRPLRLLAVGIGEFLAIVREGRL